MNDFDQFLRGLSADERLGRYLPAPMERQSPETVVLALIVALAAACEGRQPHPALVLLERLGATR